jgi:hypothetical protein
MRLKGTLPTGSQYDWARQKTTNECVDGLKKLSGLDFGSDYDAWERWWTEEKKRRDVDPDF